MPVSPFEQGHWIVPPRLPLNDAFRGVCRAGEEPFEPPERSQRELCNCGYARGRCERFVPGAADAVRFSIKAERDGIVDLVWVLEREYAPAEHGSIEYSIAEGRANGAGEVMAAQVRAFLSGYLRLILR